MNLELRPIPDSDLGVLAEIRRFSYLDSSDYSDPAIVQHHTDRLAYRVGAYVDGELAATASWLPMHVNLGGQIREVSGLASVATGATWRRRGLVRVLLRDGLEDLRANGIGWSFEHPFDPRYYAKYGWETMANGVAVDVPIDRFPSGSHEMHSFQYGAHQQAASIHSEWLRNYGFASTRQEEFRDSWKDILDGPVYRPNKAFGFVCDDAYLVGTIVVANGAQELVVRDWAFRAPRGRAEVLALLSTFQGQIERVKMQLPFDDPFAREWSPFAAAHQEVVQVRIVEVAAALRDLPVSTELDVVIGVEDDFAEWNSGAWRLTSVDGRLRASRTDDEPELRGDVRGWAQIFSGSLGAEAAARFGLIEGADDAVRSLEALQLEPTYLPWSDYF